ncbi:class I SAM-dependent methyltransferase [Desulfopila sp. IMCC35008]|uniref:class I SAM-dependent DNA methyltransferase n=1 Tax=Desulfopila sp. IMCC35008 TaxID=2653858 RepID=UPI0013D23B96|nr:class I SAM-dependent methyltransferase [Desulfopila sp. IMCC35008]
MSIYDKVGSTYDSMRSNIGIKDILNVVDILGKEIKVLDLGCGTGHPIAKVVSPIVKEYIGVDKSQPMLDAYSKNVKDGEYMLLNMTDIGQIPGKWEFIFSWGAICHLPIKQQKKVMKHVSKLLKPEGRFLFTGGKEIDECTGKIGEYTVNHYSIGEKAYKEFLSELNMDLISASFSEGNNYVYVFKKKKICT